MSARLVLVACSASLATLACGTDEPLTLPGGPSSVEVHAGWYLSFDEPIRLLEDGGTLPIRPAPQGGHFAFISARVRGISDPEMDVGARFFDVETGELLFAERRGGAVVPAADDPSFVEPALDSRGAIVHAPVCPVDDPPGLFRRTLRLVLDVAGAGPERRTGSTELQVTPDCSVGSAGAIALCECECAPDFDPGKCY